MADEFVSINEFKSFKETCQVKHAEVASLEKWISKIDARMWAFVVGLLFNSLIGLATLIMVVIKLSGGVK